jgi:hypothetical protein
MKSYLLALSLFVSLVSLGQRASLSNDTLSYKDRHFAVGDTINVLYGSGADGKFVFVSSGSAMGGVTPLDASQSKLVTKIDKMYKSSGRLLIRCKVLEGLAKNPLGGNKVFIEPEGAIDKKEIE